MTKTEFQQLKTPVILRGKESATDTINYFRVTKVIVSRWVTIYLDLHIGKIGNTRRTVYFHSEPVDVISLPLEHFTKVPWKQAKREILDLLLGRY